MSRFSGLRVLDLSTTFAAILFFTCAAPTPPPPPDASNAQLTITFPSGPSAPDTVGKPVTIVINHSITNLLDSVVVVTRDSVTSGTAPSSTARLTNFATDTNSLTQTFTTPGYKIVNAIAYYLDGTVKTFRTVLYVMAAPTPADITSPVVRITTPADSDSVRIAGVPVTIAGTATDSGGVDTVYYVRIKGAARDSAGAAGRASWSIPGVQVDSGLTMIIVRAIDAAGNAGADTIRIRYAPSVVIVKPTVSFDAQSINRTVGEADSLCSLKVALSAGAASLVKVAYALLPGGTARNDSDFAFTPDTLRFSPGETTKDIIIPLIKDNVKENSEWFKVGLTAATGGATLGTVSQDSVTILDTTTLLVSFVQTSASDTEGIGARTAAVHLSQPAAFVVKVSYAVKSGGTAVNGADFNFTPDTLKFAAGDTLKSIPFSVPNDALRNGDRDFFVALRDPSGMQLGADSTFHYTIVDNEALTVSFAAASQKVNENAALCSLLVKLSTGSTSAQSVTYQLRAGGTAVQDVDFTVSSGTLSFAAQQTQKKIAVAITNNATRDGDRTFVIELLTPSSSSGLSLGATVADTVTIVDDERVFARFVNKSDTIIEPVNGTATAYLPVRLSAKTSWPVTLSYGVKRSGTAAAQDYALANPATVTFVAGDTDTVIAVAVNSDNVKENREYVVIGLTGINPGDSLGPNTEDSLVVIDTSTLSVGFDAGTQSANESVPGGKDSIRVSLTKPASFVVTVNYAFSDGTARNGTGKDFIAINGALTFAAGSTVQYIPVSLIDNAIQDGNRTFTVALSGANGAVIAINSLTYTIIDNEQLSVSFANATATFDETAGACSLAVNLSTTSASDTRIRFSIAAGSAFNSPDSDFVSNTAAAIVIPAGATQGFVKFTVRDDGINEDAETFTLQLDSANGNAGLINLSSKQCVVTINDKDPVTVRFKRAATTMIEGSVEIDTVLLDRRSTKSFTVDVLKSSSATAPELAVSPVQLTFNPGDTLKTIVLTSTSNGLNTDTLSAILTLNNPSRSSVSVGSPAAHVTTINDLQAAPTVALSCSTAVHEPGANTNFPIISVNLDGATTGRTVTVYYSTTALTAVPGTNYTSTTGSVSFAEGTTTPASRMANVQILADDYNEDTVTFRVQIDSIVRVRSRDGYRRKDAGTMPSAVVAIIDNDVIPANVVVVKQNAAGSKSGLSWKNAFTDLQAALAFVTANSTYSQIWVAAGTYKPTSTSDQTISFVLPACSIYGGFAGRETQLGQRPQGQELWRQNISILSGDVNGNGTSDPSDTKTLFTRPSVTLVPVGSKFLIDGFTLTCAIQAISKAANFSNSSPSAADTFVLQNCYLHGFTSAAVCVNAGSNPSFPLLRWNLNNLIFDDCAGGISGTDYAYKLRATNCVFHNLSSSAASFVSGHRSVFVNCTFAQIKGAPAISGSGTDTVMNCAFWNNDSIDVRSNSHALGYTQVLYSRINPNGVDSNTVKQNCDTSATTSPFGDFGDLLGSDQLPGGGNDGLQLTPGETGLTCGTSWFMNNDPSPATDILGNIRNKGGNKCAAGAYELPYGQQ